MNIAPQDESVWFEIDDEARRYIYRPLSLVLDLKQGVLELGGPLDVGADEKKGVLRATSRPANPVRWYRSLQS